MRAVTRGTPPFRATSAMPASVGFAFTSGPSTATKRRASRPLVATTPFAVASTWSTDAMRCWTESSACVAGRSTRCRSRRSTSLRTTTNAAVVATRPTTAVTATVRTMRARSERARFTRILPPGSRRRRGASTTTSRSQCRRPRPRVRAATTRGASRGSRRRHGRLSAPRRGRRSAASQPPPHAPPASRVRSPEGRRVHRESAGVRRPAADRNEAAPGQGRRKSGAENRRRHVGSGAAVGLGTVRGVVPARIRRAATIRRVRRGRGRLGRAGRGRRRRSRRRHREQLRRVDRQQRLHPAAHADRDDRCGRRAETAGRDRERACHDPFDASGSRSVTPSVAAETVTKSVFNDESSPGAQPVPLTCTTVPGGPDVGDIVKFVTAASATPVEPTDGAHTRAAQRSQPQP